MAVTVAALTLSACSSGSSGASEPVSGSWDDVVAAANEEGKVTIYSTQAAPRLAALETAFEAAHPAIDLEVVRGVDADLLSKIDAEEKSGKGIGDVAVITDVSWMGSNKDTDAAGELIGPSFDNPEYERETSIIDDRFFLEGAVLLGFGWNTSLLPGGISSPQDFLDPSLQGKIGIVNPATSPSYLDYYSHIEKYYGGREVLEQIADQNPRVYPSNQPLAQAIASGEISAGLMADPMLPNKEAGAPVEWVAGEHIWGAKWYGLTLGTSPHPNSAQVLADFMVTQPGQAATSVGYSSALPDVEGSLARAQDIPDQNIEVTTGDGADRYRDELEQVFN
ncbi:MAG: extracellular solute-binding protein [Rhodococcus sp. (in: high G+C Gram-positive bacteria)]|nr:extracellular solute-binding protein [Rhodococcus sp. (in: high G+C Gram-positive bacteria)]MDI6626589.1 extracellular solute-binding protein [Rhodococcus sp. (in: high G+C Gram-positive bacteria)]